MSQAALKGMLQTCSLHPLIILTGKALTRAGFGDVQVMDRRSSKQKSRYGGHELLAETTVGSLPARIVVKVIPDVIRLRMLDELAGVVMRTKADLGVIVSPFHLSKRARESLVDYTNARIDVIDGAALASLLSRFKIGVRGSGEPDYAFFTALEEYSQRIIDFMAREGSA